MRPSPGGSHRRSKTGRGRRGDVGPSVSGRCARRHVVMVGGPAHTRVELYVLVRIPFRRPSYCRRIAVAVHGHCRRCRGPRDVERRSVNARRRVLPVGVGRQHLTDAVVERRHATVAAAAADVGGRWEIGGGARRRHVEKYGTRFHSQRYRTTSISSIHSKVIYSDRCLYVYSYLRCILCIMVKQ